MLQRVEKTAKTVEEAISAALNELEIDKEDADIEIIDKGSAGFLGFGGKEAKVIVSKKQEDIEEKAIDFLENVTLKMGLDVMCRSEINENHLKIELKGVDMGLLIGRRGETLDSLQYLTSLVVNANTQSYIKVTLDTENYRGKREETLTRLAKRLAVQVQKTKKSITLEPMNPNERRVIHSTLQSFKGIYTYSIGDDPNRKIVIAIKDK